MKAEIDNTGILTIIAENDLESYALDKWFEDHLITKCSFDFKPMTLKNDISYKGYCKPIVKPPEPPLDRVIAEGALFTFGLCPNCNSTVFKRKVLYGKKYCINPKCKCHDNLIEPKI